MCDLTKASVISLEKGLAVPTMQAGAERLFHAPISPADSKQAGRQAGRLELAGWLWKQDKARLILGKLKYSDGSRV